MHAEIIGTFEDKEYGFIDVKNKVVTDIGAFIGDTSIYFAIKGANTIYAIEPHPGAYEELVENIRLNNLESKIIPLNVGIGYKANYFTVNVKTKQAPQIYLRNSQGQGVKVSASTLSDIIKNYNIYTDVLKMDCEGCEYDIILNDYTTVSKFEQIVFEYHAYNTNISINNLMNILNQSHSCEFVNENIYRKNDPTWNRDKIGMIYCVKKK
jgi:FkbM family methyltransferase